MSERRGIIIKSILPKLSYGTKDLLVVPWPYILEFVEMDMFFLDEAAKLSLSVQLHVSRTREGEC